MNNNKNMVGMNRAMSFEEFVKKANNVHGFRYVYNEMSYVNAGTKVLISCKDHGEFEMIGSLHLHGQKCRKCSIEDKLSKNLKKRHEDFICRSKSKHGLKYDYSLVEYVNNKAKVKIKCNTHLEYFYQSPDSHIRGGGCPRCVKCHRYTTSEFIQAAIKIHGSKYSFDRVKYVNTSTKIIVKCQLHGEWETTPNSILSGYGCRLCGVQCQSDAKRLNTSDFILKSIKRHGDKYDYSLTEYIASDVKLKLKCKKHNRIFEQLPANHLRGAGCPICKQSKGEFAIFKFLNSNSLDFTAQYKFSDCRSKYPLPFDFMVNVDSRKVCIEFHGGQHYRPVNRFGGKKAYDALVSRDAIKAKYCEDHSIPLLVIKYDEILRVDEILTRFLLDIRNLA